MGHVGRAHGRSGEGTRSRCLQDPALRGLPVRRHHRTERALPVEGCLHWAPARPSTYPNLDRLIPPTLLLQGTNDLFCPLEWAEWEKRHAVHAKLVVIPGGGHGNQGSRSDATARNAVLDFLLR